LKAFPRFTHLPTGSSTSIVEFLKDNTLAHESKKQIRQLVKTGGVVVNGRKVTDLTTVLGPEIQLPGGHLVVCVGSKEFHNYKV
jgi:tyrosyl-tRNA synthetase